MAENGNGNGTGNSTGKIGRTGFLPIHTNAFDRVFIGTVIFVALHLLWMRFLEAHIPLYAATMLAVLIGAVIVARG
jgi:predicted small integral membrane protein